MKTNHLAGLLLGTAFLLAGCNVQTNAGPKPADNGTVPAAPAAPAAPAPANSGAAPAQGDATPSAEVQGAARQNFAVLNNTGHTVVTLKVSPTNDNNWGPDILGREVLPNGQSAQITFPHDTTQCMWDIQATYDDGTNTDMRGVNLCTVATVTLTP